MLIILFYIYFSFLLWLVVMPHVVCLKVFLTRRRDKLPRHVVELKEEVRHAHLLKPDRPRHVAAPGHGQRVLLLPLDNVVKAAALVVDVKVGPGAVLRLEPLVRDNVDAARAHDVFEENVGAVRDVDPVEGPVLLAVDGGVVVVGLPRLVPQQVEAVDLVEHVNLRHVGVVAEAVRRRELDGHGGVLAEAEQLGFRDGEDADVFEGVPVRLDGLVRRQEVAVGVAGVVRPERAADDGVVGAQLDAVPYGGCGMLVCGRRGMRWTYSRRMCASSSQSWKGSVGSSRA